jgi:PTS system glucitol/sorbitol-specific IIA component
MSVLLKTRVTAMGPEVADLAEGGVVILFADGAPPELAEVSMLHQDDGMPSDQPAGRFDHRIGPSSRKITAVGDHAWKRCREIGHVVISFNGSDHVDRPGEICASEVDTANWFQHSRWARRSPSPPDSIRADGLCWERNTKTRVKHGTLDDRAECMTDCMPVQRRGSSNSPRSFESESSW